MNDRKSLTRLELYELVWSEPISQIAPRFGLSDQGLSKKCKAHKIPRPPRGYWAKVQNGYKIKKPPLKKLGDSPLNIVRFNIKPVNSIRPLVPEHQLDQAQLKFLDRYSAASKVYRYDKAISICKEQANAKKGSHRLDNYGRILFPNHINNPGLKITPDTLLRACKILQKLIDLFSKFGWEFMKPSNEVGMLGFAQFTHRGAELSVAVKEKVTKLTGESRNRYSEISNINSEMYWYSEPRYGTTGELEVYVDTYLPGLKKSWKDDKNGLVEEKFGDIAKVMSQLFEGERLAIIKREVDRLEYEKAVQERRVREQLIRAEQKRREELFAIANRHTEIVNLRKLITAIEQKCSKSADVEDWISWANAVAEELDPLSNIDDLAQMIKEPSNR